MKILLYAPNLGRVSTNGTAISLMVSQLSKYLLQKGHEVLIVCNRAVVEEDVKTSVISLSKGFDGDIQYAKRLSSIIRDFKPHIVYSYMRTMSQILGLSTLFGKEPETFYMGSVHNADGWLRYGRFYYLPYRNLVGSLLNRLDVVAGPSIAVLEDLSRTFFVKKEKLFLHRNFIDFERIKALSEVEPPPEGEYILNVGRLSPQKNHLSLIRVFSKIAREFPELKLVIVGEGEERKPLEELIYGLGLRGRVILTGYRENPWVYYKGARLFVLTSRHEGFGNVLLEAMYFRVPIVAFDIPPVREALCDGQLGLLAKAFDEEELYMYIKSILSGERKVEDMVERAYRHALGFSVDAYYKNMLDVYRGKDEALRTLWIKDGRIREDS